MPEYFRGASKLGEAQRICSLLVNGEKRVERIEPAFKGSMINYLHSMRFADLQITGHGSAGSNLRGYVGCPILVSVTEARAVNESEGLRFI